MVLGILAGLLVVSYVILLVYLETNKKSIIKDITAEFSEKINGKVSVGDAEISILRSFPGISVLMNKVEIVDSLYDLHKKPLLKADELYVSLSISKLINKQPALNGVKIRNGIIHLFTADDGYSNSYLFRPKDRENNTGNKKNDIRFIDLKNTAITIEDIRKNKLHKILASRMIVEFRNKGSQTFMDTDLDLQVDGLGFNRAKGVYLGGKRVKGDFSLVMDNMENMLSFNRIPVDISGQLFNMTGKFLLRERSVFELQVETKGAGYEFIRQIVPAKISASLSIIKLSKPVDALVKVNGSLKGGAPLVNINFAVQGSDMATPFFDFNKASFKGIFTNQVTAGLARNDSNSLIQLKNFTAEWHSLPIKSATIQILNLKNPVLSCDLESAFNIEELNELIGSSSIDLRKGNGIVKLNYHGPIVRNNQTNSFLNGFINLRNGQVYYAPRDVELKDLTADISFRNSDMYIQNMRSNVLGHDIQMEGFARNLLTLINTEPNKVNISWKIFSPKINLSTFTYLLKKRKQGVSEKKGKGIYQVADKIDRALDDGRLDVIFQTNQLNYKKFAASDVTANLSLLHDRYVLNNVSMNHAGGRMGLSGALINTGKDFHQASINANLDNINVNSLFNAFSNFGQDGITASNLNGDLSSKVNASMLLNEEGSVQGSSLEAVVDFSLKNGELTNYEPVKKLQRFVFKNRDFDNIRFAEIKDRLTVSNREVRIGKMEIQSNVMSLFVEGLYSQRGNTDISIQVPLSNLKKRGDDYNPENIGVEARKGRSIFLRGRPGPDGNIKFKLDLFNRYDKSKN